MHGVVRLMQQCQYILIAHFGILSSFLYLPLFLSPCRIHRRHENSALCSLPSIVYHAPCVHDDSTLKPNSGRLINKTVKRLDDGVTSTFRATFESYDQFP